MGVESRCEPSAGGIGPGSCKHNKVQTIVRGALLILLFENIFLYAAVSPHTDIVLDEEDLSGWAARLWARCT
jgi:hypothetical protein